MAPSPVSADVLLSIGDRLIRSALESLFVWLALGYLFLGCHFTPTLGPSESKRIELACGGGCRRLVECGYLPGSTVLDAYSSPESDPFWACRSGCVSESGGVEWAESFEGCLTANRCSYALEVKSVGSCSSVYWVRDASWFDPDGLVPSSDTMETDEVLADADLGASDADDQTSDSEEDVEASP